MKLSPSFFKKIAANILGYNRKFVYPAIVDSNMISFFHDADLAILDIGARGGPYPLLEILAPHSRLTLCEPDKNEAERIKNGLQERWREVRVISSAIGTKNKEKKLNVTRFPGLSSLLEPDRKVIEKYFLSRPNARESREAWEVIETRSVPMITLDEACNSHGGRWDLIKLDTQGTEFDILLSGKKIALRDTVVVYVETEFIPFYRDQSLFGEIHSFLSAEGFRLFDLKRTNLRRADIARRPPYSKRELAWAHVLYVRERKSDGRELSPQEIHRLSCLLTAFWFFDSAVALLESSKMNAYLQPYNPDKLADALERYSRLVWEVNRRRLLLRTRPNVLGMGWQDQIIEP